jgi:hypothetical protein
MLDLNLILTSKQSHHFINVLTANLVGMESAAHYGVKQEHEK